MKINLSLLLLAAVWQTTVRAQNFLNHDSTVGLLAGRLGVVPVPGGSFTTGGGRSGPFQRDGSCWCQPINQVCTELRPRNLDLVTRGVDLGFGGPITQGLPGIPNPATASSCGSERRLCCPSLHGFASLNHAAPSQVPSNQGLSIQEILNQEFLNHRFPNQGFPSQRGSAVNLIDNRRQCGTRGSFGAAPGISPTADFGEYPWMAVVLGPGDAYVAGGVMIADSWVLTAPHALAQRNGLKVRLGDYDVGSVVDVPQFSHYEVPVTRVIIHPQFNSRTLANDVALLQLAEPINRAQYPHVTPACLPAQGQKFDGRRCYVTGWGKDAFGPGNFQRKLQEVDVPVIDGFRCEDQFRNTRLGNRFILDKHSFMCAGGEQNKDACEGDGGSPLVCGGGNQGWTVAGLVAWGIGCAERDVPAAYVNVASYANFIRRYVQ